MSNNDNRLYWYEDARELVITRDSIYVDNRPMNNRQLKAHKGLTNELLFNIRDRDRKLQNMFAYQLNAYLIDPSTKKRILVRQLEHTTDIGKVKLILREGDLVNVRPGRYFIYISRQDTSSESTAIYKDQDNNVKFDIEITDQIGTEPVPTQIETEFPQQGDTGVGDPANTFVSSAMEGNVCRNFTNAQHTMALYLNSYTGNIRVQGSCINGAPDSDDDSKDWFDVETLTIANVSQTVQVTSFLVNCNWVRVVLVPTTGTVDKVELRN